MSQSEAPRVRAASAMGEGKLFPNETFWRDLQPWLKDQGYTLRDRYQPDWVASWKKDSGKEWMYCEDSITADSYNILDAVRQDGTLVALKRIKSSRYPDEVAIGRLFSSAPLAGDPNNYCVPILDVLQVPDNEDFVIIIMPLLYHYNIAPLETIGEGVEFIRQLLEGLNLMHQNNVAHRDCKFTNIMADLRPLFDAPPHPFSTYMRRDFKGVAKICSSRTRRPLKQYLVDFGLSKVYRPEHAPHLETGGWGGDRTVPEFLVGEDALCDPFPVDVYCMGNFIRTHFTEGSRDFPRKLGFEFLRGIVNDMVQDDPKQRPRMNEVVARFNDTVNGLSSWKLRSRVVVATETRPRRIARSIGHWMKQTVLMVQRVPALPKA